MKERPILMSGPMVRALLDGSKTQTRRVVKPQPPAQFPVGWIEGDAAFWSAVAAGDFPMWEQFVQCPYGQPGDRLWVRERWASLTFERDWESGIVDGWHDAVTAKEGNLVYDADDHGIEGDTPDERGFSWRPSIHMPRWASRITLELTGVRVERVQEITAADCIAEGIPSRGIDRDGPCIASAIMYIHDYEQLWNALNADRGYGWDMNPWVWVLDFRRVEVGRD